jgi:hypothetical protein
MHPYTPPPASNSWPDSESLGAVCVGSGELKQYTWRETGLCVLIRLPKRSERRWWIHDIFKSETVRLWSVGSDPEYTAVHHSTRQYTAVHHSTPQYTTVHRSTPQYTAVHHSAPQYTCRFTRGATLYHAIFLVQLYGYVRAKGYWVRLDVFAKLLNGTVSFVTPIRISVRPHRTTRLPG